MCVFDLVCLFSVVWLRKHGFTLAVFYPSLLQIKLPFGLEVKPLLLVFWTAEGNTSKLYCVVLTLSEVQSRSPAMCRMVFLQYSSALGMTVKRSRPQLCSGLPCIAYEAKRAVHREPRNPAHRTDPSVKD